MIEPNDRPERLRDMEATLAARTVAQPPPAVTVASARKPASPFGAENALIFLNDPNRAEGTPQPIMLATAQ